MTRVYHGACPRTRLDTGDTRDPDILGVPGPCGRLPDVLRGGRATASILPHPGRIYQHPRVRTTRRSVNFQYSFSAGDGGRRLVLPATPPSFLFKFSCPRPGIMHEMAL
jgi:hypothetical protein